MGRQQKALPEDEVEFALVDLPIVEAQREDDGVEHVLDLFELGPLVAFGQILDQQRMET